MDTPLGSNRDLDCRRILFMISMRDYIMHGDLNKKSELIAARVFIGQIYPDLAENLFPNERDYCEMP